MRRTEHDEIEQLRIQESQLDARQIQLARENVNTFIETVGKFTFTEDLEGRPVRDYERLVQFGLHVDLQQKMTVHKYLMIKSFPGCGKTTQVALRKVWELGHDPNKLIMIFSKHAMRSSPCVKLSRMMMAYCLDPTVRAIFPNLQMSRTIRSDYRWQVVRSMAEGDPTCRTGALNKSPTGGRVTDIVIDDLYDDENVRSEQDGMRILSWVKKSLISRGGGNPNMRVVWLTNAWHDRDPSVLLEEEQQKLELLGRERVWEIVEYPLLDSSGCSLHPEIIPDESIPTLRDKFGDEFELVFELKTMRDEDRTFTVDILDRTFAPDVGVVHELDEDTVTDPRFVCVIGCDPATGKRTRKKKSDFSSLSVVLGDLHSGQYRELWQWSDRVPPNQLAMKILMLVIRYWPDEVCVEDNQCQTWLKDIVKLVYELEQLRAERDGRRFDLVMPTITCRFTGRQKYDPIVGVRSLAAEMDDERHLLPSTRVESDCVASLIRQRDGFYAYSDTTHAADEVMSYWITIERIREIIRTRSRRTPEGQVSRGVKSFSLGQSRKDKTREALKTWRVRSDDPYASLR